jgi:hypothetical protein
VFTHEANDCLVAMHMSLRREQDHKPRRGDNNEYSDKQRVPVHYKIELLITRIPLIKQI